jgi:hypothetical protein
MSDTHLETTELRIHSGADRFLESFLGWCLLWVLIFSVPVLLWLSFWLLLPSPVIYAVLVTPSAMGLIVCFWRPLSREQRPGNAPPDDPPHREIQHSRAAA